LFGAWQSTNLSSWNITTPNGTPRWYPNKWAQDHTSLGSTISTVLGWLLGTPVWYCVWVWFALARLKQCMRRLMP